MKISPIGSWFPDRQILIRGADRISSVKISQVQQICGLALAAAVVLALAGTSLGMACAWRAGAKTALAARQMASEAAFTQAAIRRVMAENAVLIAQRNQAVAAADQARDAAVAQADLARDEAVARATLITAANHEAVAELALQTESEIGEVTAIIRSTGMNPARFAQTPRGHGGAGTPAGQAMVWSGVTAGEQSKDDALLDDLSRLEGLGGVLEQMPLAAPVEKISVTSPFGYRPDPWTGAREFHVGVDLRGAIGTPVFATAPGLVVFAGVSTGYGNLVTIDHGYGLETRYSHLDRILVSAGTMVDLHQEIGLLGNTGWSTGPHLLYETRVDGEPENPLNFIKVYADDVQK